VDLAREVARTARLYRLNHVQLVTGEAALEAFRSDYLMPRCSGSALPHRKRFGSGSPKSARPRPRAA
jgi:hypothetical protein